MNTGPRRAARPTSRAGLARGRVAMTFWPLRILLIGTAFPPGVRTLVPGEKVFPRPCTTARPRHPRRPARPARPPPPAEPAFVSSGRAGPGRALTLGLAAAAASSSNTPCAAALFGQHAAAGILAQPQKPGHRSAQGGEHVPQSPVASRRELAVLLSGAGLCACAGSHHRLAAQVAPDWHPWLRGIM
jgi:hypothetical protein